MLYLISLFAGMLTILAPCALPMIPVICGRGVGSDSWKRTLVILSSFVFSIVAFTLLLKSAVSCVSIGNDTLKNISAVILLVFGLVMLFPHIRDTIAQFTGIGQAGILLNRSKNFDGIFGDVLLGASLGPVFSSCSPTYSLIVAVVLPASFVSGVVAIFFYAIGLASILFLVTRGGRTMIKKLQFASNSDGWLKKIIGFLIILTGIAIMTGADKTIESLIVQNTGTSLVERESSLLDTINK